MNLERTKLRSSPECPFCDCLKVPHSWFDDQYCSQTNDKRRETMFEEYAKKVFHQPCSKCPAQSENTLCEFCKHLRIEHILKCTVNQHESEYNDNPSERDPVTQNTLSLKLGTLGDLKHRSKGCTVCAAFVNAVGSSPVFSSSAELTLTVPYEKADNYDFKFEMAVQDGDREPYHLEFQGFNEKTRYYKRALRHQSRGLDWDTLSHWLYECNTLPNDKVSRSELLLSSKTLFMIDVSRWCIVDAPLTCTYAALSYVWGAPTGGNLQLTTHNLSELRKELALNRVSHLPATIRDAIMACKRLGIPYLWVDRLCILQDNVVRKQRMIKAMGEIYSWAYVTLVALAGDNAFHGLPGVSHRGRRSPLTISINELECIRLAPHLIHVKEWSTWSSRGWTFQEGRLSQRLLLFSYFAVFFECAHDSKNTDHTTGQATLPLHLKDAIAEWSYFGAVESFTERTLSFEADIIRAFQGVLHSKYETAHYFGLPHHSFHDALFWVSGTDKYIPRKPYEGEFFPSWSWCSIKGQIRFPYGGSAAAIPLATFAVLIPVPFPTPFFLRLIRNSSLASWLQREGNQTDWSVYNDRVAGEIITTVWRAGCLPGRLPEDLTAEDSPVTHETLSKWKSIRHLANDAQGITNPGSSLYCLGSENENRMFPPAVIDRHTRIPGRLIAYAQSVRIRMASLEGAETDTAKIVTMDGRFVGYLITETTKHFYEIYQSYKDDSSVSLHASAVSLGWRAKESEHDCQSLSLHHPNGPPPINASRTSTQYFLHEHSVLVYLMIIQINQHGISRRVALGEGLINNWLEADPEWKTFQIE